MSLLPYLCDYDLGLARAYPPGCLDDLHFGVGPQGVLTVTPGSLMTKRHYNPWKHIAAVAQGLGSSIKADEDKFQINVDVQHFSPDEITVKTADGYVVVEGKHEEKKDEHGFVSRQFVRRYALPDGISLESVESKLSSDGVLTITAPMKVPEAVKGERKVPIARTGPVRKEIKDRGDETEKREENKEENKEEKK